MEQWMGRTVHLSGGDVETLELGQPLDGAFDGLYATFENGIPSLEGEFRNAVFQYFDQYIGSDHAPAAHDHRLHRHHPDHINPLGGAWRDDHPENIQAVHWWCNGEKGSSRA
jgi:hypothetical protein